MKKLLSILGHRITMVVVLLLVQIAVLAATVVLFSDYFIYVYFICVALSVLVSFYVVDRQMDPGFKIGWIVVILFAPLFGGLFYLLCGGSGLTRRQKRRMEDMDRHLSDALAADRKSQELAPWGKDAVSQSHYLEEYAHCPPYANTYTRYFSLGDKALEPLLEELERAERYIFLEYFIIAPGQFWDAVLAILERKAAAGVDVRVIYDDVGCLTTLPKDFAASLEEKGIRCRAFNRFLPVLSVRLNNRDHRKLCIVDGHTAFTGGINLADEYINRKRRFGHWKDSAILLKGEGAWPMTVMFLTMWEYICGSRESFASYRPKTLPAVTGEGWVQPYTDCPLDREPVGATVYLNLINKAREYVYITTPYLVVSDSLNTALCTAAKNGVDVRIMTPGIPDKKTVFEVTQAHYEPLLAAGVRIFEYTPGFLHAKTFVADDRYAAVGSVNMDYRSLFLHFENGVWLCGSPTVLDVKEDFLSTQAKCREITLDMARSHGFLRGLFRSVLRLFAPLM